MNKGLRATRALIISMTRRWLMLLWRQVEQPEQIQSNGLLNISVEQQPLELLKNCNTEGLKYLFEVYDMCNSPLCCQLINLSISSPLYSTVSQASPAHLFLQVFLAVVFQFHILLSDSIRPPTLVAQSVADIWLPPLHSFSLQLHPPTTWRFRGRLLSCRGRPSRANIHPLDAGGHRDERARANTDAEQKREWRVTGWKGRFRTKAVTK